MPEALKTRFTSGNLNRNNNGAFDNSMKRNISKLVSLVVLISLLCINAFAEQKKGDNPVEVYRPSIQPGQTFQSSSNDLLRYIAVANWVYAVKDGYSFPVKCEIDKNRIALLHQNNNKLIASFNISDLMEQNIYLRMFSKYQILLLPGIVNLSTWNAENAKRIANALYFLQKDVRDYRDALNKQTEELKPLAEEYRNLPQKPAVSEEQRKLIVQANALAERKEYYQARDKYREALKISKTDYPGAYFNMALLEAQLNLPFAAISYMKQYLMLVPDAPDARSAKDKIYEWELLMPKPVLERFDAKVTTKPADAFVEIRFAEAEGKWVFLGRAPKDASFQRDNVKYKTCLFRISKPGYETQEVSYVFENLPRDVFIKLKRSKSGSKDSYGYVGIVFKDLSSDVATANGIENKDALLVESVVDNSPAQEAGIQAKDIITSINEKEVHERIDLIMASAETPIGETVELGIVRDKKPMTIQVKVAKQTK
jgi:PDZ domain